MRYIHFFGGTGYCGCDFDEYQKFPDDTPDDLLDTTADDMAIENGESFTHCATGWGDDFEDEQEEEDYYESCWGDWREISEEEYKEATT